MEKIRRFLSPPNLELMQRDGDFLVKAVERSRGELYLALRDDYLNVYYRGSSLAEIRFVGGGAFEVRIHREFVAGEAGASLSSVVQPRQRGQYHVWRVSGHDLHVLLQSAHRTKLQTNIKKRNFSEEGVFEQMFIWDNQARDDFILIDRQVQPRGPGAKKLDLLALRRTGDTRYRFMAIEAKLGNNAELQGRVFEQLEGYVGAITQHFVDYKTCYEENYRQQRVLGLLSSGPTSIEIEPGVEGSVVVFAHSGPGSEAVNALRARHPQVKVEQFRFRLDLASLDAPKSLA